MQRLLLQLGCGSRLTGGAITEAGRTWVVRPHRHLCGAVRHRQMGWSRGLSASRLHVSCYLMRIVEAMGLGRMSF